MSAEHIRYEWAWPCPECDEYFVPNLDLLVWREGATPEQAPQFAGLACPHCRMLIDDSRKVEMNARGAFIATGQRVAPDGTAYGEIAAGDATAGDDGRAGLVLLAENLACRWSAETGERVEDLMTLLVRACHAGELATREQSVEGYDWEFVEYLVNRDHFRRWLLAVRRPLPAFWYEEGERRAHDAELEQARQQELNAARGRRSVEGGAIGNENAYGTDEEKRQRWGSYDDFVRAKHSENPHSSYDHCCGLAAKHFGCSKGTIKNHVGKRRPPWW